MASVKKRLGYGYEVRYVDPTTGKRPSKTFELKKDAEAYKRKVEREIEDGLHVGRSSTKTMGDVFKEYLADSHLRKRDGRIGEGHSRRQEMVVRVYLAPALGQLLARELSHKHVADLYGAMVDKGLHARSAKQYLSVLQMTEKFARRRGYLKTQPVTDALGDLRGIPVYKVETFTPAEVARLLVAASELSRGRSLRAAAFMGGAVALAALCGLRAGEILGLHAASVDLDRRVIRIRHNLTAYREIKGPKTMAGIRDVPIPARALDLLIYWRETFGSGLTDGPFFVTTGGKAYTYGALHEGWKRLLERQEMQTRHFHALRHFYASWLLRHGMPVADVSKMIGHSSHDMTLRVYTHALLENDEAVSHVDRIAGLLPRGDALTTLETTRV